MMLSNISEDITSVSVGGRQHKIHEKTLYQTQGMHGTLELDDKFLIHDSVSQNIGSGGGKGCTYTAFRGGNFRSTDFTFEFGEISSRLLLKFRESLRYLLKIINYPVDKQSFILEKRRQV